MYLFEIRGIKCPCKNESYLPKAKLPKKKIKGISAHITTAFLNTKMCIHREIIIYVLTLRSTNKCNRCNNGIRASKQI